MRASIRDILKAIAFGNIVCCSTGDETSRYGISPLERLYRLKDLRSPTASLERSVALLDLLRR
jgi:hypothetical protein